MYLENAEQTKVCGEGEPSTEAMLTEQCQIPKLTEVTELTRPSKGSGELGIDALVEYTEQTISREVDSSLLCVEHCNMNRDESESFIYCNGHAEGFEQYSASNRLFESDQILNKCKASLLSQPSDVCAQNCECLKSCRSSEYCNVHSLSSKCSPCCEDCAEHLRLFQQCRPSAQQFESSDYEPGKFPVNSDISGHCEMSCFIKGSTDHLELLPEHEPSDQQCQCFDSEPDTSTKDSEPRETTGFTPTTSDSADLSYCGTELCECDEIQTQTEYTDNDEEESYPPEQNETEASCDESCGLWEEVNSSHFDAADQEYFDDSEDLCFACECCEKYLDGKEPSQQDTAIDMSTSHCEMCRIGDCETNPAFEQTQQRPTSDKTRDSLEFCTEEDGSSDCSSMESKSFKTCPDGSIPSDPCSDSSGESEKGAQEESSDEQALWESFEDDEIEQRNPNKSNEDEKKTPTVDIIEDYFDLFDRDDYYGCAFAQKQHYISCFEGGDIHDCLYLKEDLLKCSAKNAYTFEEINVQGADVCFDALEEAYEDYSEEDAHTEGDCESEAKPEDWIVDSESSLAEDEVEEIEYEAHAPYVEAEEDETTFHEAACTSEGHVSEISDDEAAQGCSSCGNKESMCAPCAKDIFVESDAYEDAICGVQNYEFLDNKISMIDHVWSAAIDFRKDDEPEPEDKTFTECSEMESYWSLIYNVDNGEVFEPDVEEYYAYQIKSIQSSVEQALNEFILNRKSYQIVNEETNGDAFLNETEDALLPVKETEAAEVCPEECKEVTFRITEVTELDENIVNCSAVEKTGSEQTPDSDKDPGSNNISGEISPPIDVIHSVVSEPAKIEGRDAQDEENKASEQSEEWEEEQSDDESSEPCECVYCCPLTQQAPAKPLLPQMKSNDTGKICVVIDLDETLVHSSFKPVNSADFIIPVEIDGTIHQVYVLKRPHVDEFLKRMGELFECVLFTASLAKYADPVSDLLDKWGTFRSRLFRESCVFHKGSYVKDLSFLGRDLNKVIIIDNSPASYVFQPDNAVPVASWFDDMSDTELLDLIPFFEKLSKVDDIYDVLRQQRTLS